MRRFVGLAVLVLGLSVVAAGCTGSDPGVRPAADREDTIVVGVSGRFPENQLVAEMYAQVLEDAGYLVERQFELRSREVSQNALESGQIDVKPEYLSSLLLFIDPNAEVSNDPAEVVADARALLEPIGIALLEPSPAQDTNQFVANAQTAERFGLTTMSSLVPVAGELTLGAPPECPQRVLCLPGLKETYGIVFHDFRPLDVGGPQTVAALRNDEVQIALLFSTDPRIEANGFVPLVDDKQLQNAEHITPMIRADRLDEDVRGLLDGVSARLTNDDVTELMGKVVIEGEDIAVVARGFLLANGLL